MRLGCKLMLRIGVFVMVELVTRSVADHLIKHIVCAFIKAVHKHCITAKQWDQMGGGSP